MVKDAGSPGIKRQIIGQKNLKSFEAQYEQALQQLGNVIKVTAKKHYPNSNVVYIDLRFQETVFF